MSAILFSVLLILTLLADSASTGVLLVLVAIATGAAAIAAMTGHRTSNGQKKSRPRYSQYRSGANGNREQ